MEVASFFANDVDELVRAALACPCCLSGQVAWAIGDDGGGALVRCSCTACGHERPVGLTDDQALRLVVAPPA